MELLGPCCMSVGIGTTPRTLVFGIRMVTTMLRIRTRTLVRGFLIVMKKMKSFGLSSICPCLLAKNSRKESGLVA